MNTTGVREEGITRASYHIQYNNIISVDRCVKKNITFNLDNHMFDRLTAQLSSFCLNSLNLCR